MTEQEKYAARQNARFEIISEQLGIAFDEGLQVSLAVGGFSVGGEVSVLADNYADIRKDEYSRPVRVCIDLIESILIKGSGNY